MSEFLHRRDWLTTAFLPFWPFRPRHQKIAGIRFDIIRHGRSPHRYFHVHGNEITARELLREHMKKHKGTGFTVQSLERQVPLAGLEIDPNRMFSRIGAHRNLRRVNPGLSEASLQNALVYLDREREKFVKAILPPEGGLLIALHNNGPGYSVHTEIPISDEVSLADPDNPREFMLAVNRADFDILKTSPFNVVLQDKAPPDDDGSLSRLCTVLGVRYVNIEARLGNLEGQRRMLDFIESKLP
ncbi:MAG: hypothetical protein K2X03_20685 [Bryobacteraceae bacterium]|nr:hypothetical protein [Bryobacteraceae bacterium]